MNTQPVGFRLTGPAFMFETHLAGRPQADRLCFYVDVHTYIRQAGEDESFVLVADDDAPPSLTSPATSDSSPPTPPIRPVPGAPEPDPPPDRLPGPPDPLPDRHAEPVTAPLWKKVDALGASRRVQEEVVGPPWPAPEDPEGAGPRGRARCLTETGGGLLRVGSGLTSHHPPPNTAPYAVRMLPAGLGAGISRKKLQRRRDQGPRLDGRWDQGCHEAGERF